MKIKSEWQEAISADLAYILPSLCTGFNVGTALFRWQLHGNRLGLAITHRGHACVWLTHARTNTHTHIHTQVFKQASYYSTFTLSWSLIRSSCIERMQFNVWHFRFSYLLERPRLQILSIDHFRNVLWYSWTLCKDMSPVRVTVIIYDAPLWDRKRYCQRTSATLELCGWILVWLTAFS